MDKYEETRINMVERVIKPKGITDESVLNALAKVPRDKFVLREQKRFSYEDFPLPIGEGQTISQPYIVAEMTQLLQLSKTDKVLEIGTGSGYQTAILAEVVDQVYTIERIPSLHNNSKNLLTSLGYQNIIFKLGDGTKGWEENSPFNAIIVTAAAPKPPEPLISQLGIGGRMVIPSGDRNVQGLFLIKRDEHGIKIDEITLVKFVPLIGKYGWSD